MSFELVSDKCLIVNNFAMVMPGCAIGSMGIQPSLGLMTPSHSVVTRWLVSFIFLVDMSMEGRNGEC